MGTLLRAEVSRLRAGQRPADGKPGDGEPAANGKVTLSPAHTAVRIRGALVRWIGWLRSRGPSTGPAGAWIGARKTPCSPCPPPCPDHPIGMLCRVGRD